jgi:hypothetical protein
MTPEEENRIIKEVSQLIAEETLAETESSSAAQSLVDRLRKRAEIRRQIPSRRSVQENKPDRISDLLEEAADRIVYLESQVNEYKRKDC